MSGKWLRRFNLIHCIKREIFRISAISVQIYRVCRLSAEKVRKEKVYFAVF